MKKTILALGFLTIGLMATDYSTLTLDELLALRGTVSVEDQADYQAEMVNRMDSLSSVDIATLLTSQSPTKAGNNNQLSLLTFDTDGDGLVNEDEYTTAIADRVAQNIEDGRLLSNVDNATDFSTLDINKDGVLDSIELLSNSTQSRNSQAPASQRSQGQRDR
jgi:hypothetical protein